MGYRKVKVLFLAAAWATCAAAQPAGTLSGTKPLDWEGDLSVKMMDGAHRFVERKIRESAVSRQKHWKRDLSSSRAYEESVEPNRRRFREITGVVDPRGSRPAWSVRRMPAAPNSWPSRRLYRVYQVRWPVLDGVYGEGLLLEPKSPPSAYVIALPDADQTPEQIAGLAPGLAPASQYARRLAEQGCLVLAPVLIDRTARWSGRAGHSHDRSAAPRMDLPPGVPDGPPYHRLRGAKGARRGGLAENAPRRSQNRRGRLWRRRVSGFLLGGDGPPHRRRARQRLFRFPRAGLVRADLPQRLGAARSSSAMPKSPVLVAPRALTVEYSEAPSFTSTKGDLATPAVRERGG